MGPHIEFYKASSSKRGNNFDIQVFRKNFRYQYCKGLGDVLRGIVGFIPRLTQFFQPVAMKGVQTRFTPGSEAIKTGDTVKNVIKSTLKPTVGAVLGAMVDQVASKLIQIREN